MKITIKHRSFFKDEARDVRWFEAWATRLEKDNGRTYERYDIRTSLGRTRVWGLNTTDEDLETLVIFPGARTTSLVWDLDRGLDNLKEKLRIFLVETNGLPNPSEGNTPDIRSLGYGWWAEELLAALGIRKAFIAGASFGGLICMKLAIARPERIEAAFLLNPGCLQPFSLTPANLYYNLLPIVLPSERNISRFLNKAVFHAPGHRLSEGHERMLVEYELFALRRYRDRTQKPYPMGPELARVTVDTYLLVGDKDLLFPFQRSIDNARRHIPALKEVAVFTGAGHGIETSGKAMEHIGRRIRSYR